MRNSQFRSIRSYIISICLKLIRTELELNLWEVCCIIKSLNRGTQCILPGFWLFEYFWPGRVFIYTVEFA